MLRKHRLSSRPLLTIQIINDKQNTKSLVKGCPAKSEQPRFVSPRQTHVLVRASSFSSSVLAFHYSRPSGPANPTT